MRLGQIQAVPTPLCNDFLYFRTRLLKSFVFFGRADQSVNINGVFCIIYFD